MVALVVLGSVEGSVEGLVSDVFGVVDASSLVRGADVVGSSLVGSVVRGADGSAAEVVALVVLGSVVRGAEVVGSSLVGSVVRGADGSDVAEVLGSVEGLVSDVFGVVVSFAFTVTWNFVSCLEPSRK